MRGLFSGTLAALLALPAHAVGDGFATVTAVPVEKPLVVQDATAADVNGDGRPDLLVVAAPARPRFDRKLLVYLGRRGGSAFAPSPDITIDLPDDVVALAPGDVLPDPGREIVLFSGHGAYAWQPGRERQRAIRLAEADVLWQLPHPTRVILWEAGVRDIDGDGLDDLLIPEPDGYRIALQRRGASGEVTFDPVSVIRLPPDPVAEAQAESLSGLLLRGDRRRIEVALRLGDRGGEPSGPLLDVIESVPAPQLADWDADGDLDLLALTASRLHVWTQDNGRFQAVRPEGFASPVTVDRGRLFDISYGAYAGDLDGDGRVDCVMFAGDQRADEVRTQVLVFLQAAGPFGPGGVPQQVLVIAGFAGAARLDDVDGDGRPDLVAMSFRPDFLETIKGGGDIEVELYVYRNEGGRFSRNPHLTHVMRLPAKDLDDLSDGVLARFIGDLTGDGVQEFVVRDQARRVRVLMTRARRGSLAMVERPLWQMRIHKDAQLTVVGADDERPPQLLVRERHQVVHVSFP